MEIKYNFENLKKFITEGYKIACGNNNSYIYYDGVLVNFCKEIIDAFRRNKNIDEDDIIRIFCNNKGEITKKVIDFNKLDYFKKVSKNIALTKLPKGVLYYESIPIGTIEPYFEKHHWLHFLEDVGHKEMYLLLKDILLRLHELEQNGIYRLGLDRNNIMYNDKKPELVDLMDSNVTCGKDKILEQNVYSNYLDLLYAIIHRQSFDANLYREFRDVLTINDCNYDVCRDVLKRLKKKF